ncbi:cytochrome c family protein [Akkermansiaceae bacterium]|nr:cytochrome c family protein [Akkermansiaceae bacterium]MDA7935956.1 cytochrome c family protein [bacterium]MDB0068039.1 cytochrome c family protein [Akkermansiaceae bacterium]MDB4257831.1 cytochrome c family protein [bacterium]MDB4283370.1 cytochrome c family protein [Akkermansiaceae bacterium]
MANIFPRWVNILPLKIAVCLGAVGAGLVGGFTYYGTPKAQRVGYQPSQPIPYDHNLHVNQLGMDCRYCHSFTEHSSHANVPTANTCWNCHQHVQKGSPKLAALRGAMGVDENHLPLKDVNGNPVEGEPIKWVRVHKAPDYVYFNHSAHLNRGISCQSCHGDVHKMEVVHHAESHSMGWCLECHRAPEKHVRPLEEVFNLDYDAEEYLKANEVIDSEGLVLEKGKQIETAEDFGKFLVAHWGISPKESCSTCHR